MKWETLKRNVASELYASIIRSCDPETNAAMIQDLIASEFKTKAGKSRGEFVQQYADKAWDVIMHWDVRSVGRLRELFPWAFRGRLRTGPLVAFVADNKNSDWMVEARS